MEVILITVSASSLIDDPASEILVSAPWHSEHAAVHQSVDGPAYGWTVTHIPTGLAICKSVATARHAIEIAELFEAQLTDAGLDLSSSDRDVLEESPEWNRLAIQIDKTVARSRCGRAARSF